LMECLTLIQTDKLRKDMIIVLFGSKYWNDVVDFDQMVRWGVISREDLDLFKITDSVDQAFKYITRRLSRSL
jgi:predicted Rossmann-fold nucleotide-binding protein